MNKVVQWFMVQHSLRGLQIMSSSCKIIVLIDYFLQDIEYLTN